jgi:hypothetical protein
MHIGSSRNNNCRNFVVCRFRLTAYAAKAVKKPEGYEGKGVLG